MRLLLVDDEEFTRQGIYNKLAWGEIGIREVFTADDGLNGLAAARKVLPDIVLTDVRMPRMDGIKMAYEIRKILPECSIIFMSGYSDREYLKAAINLSALGYVDKPIDIGELSEEIKSAAALLQQAKQRRLAEQEMQDCLNVSLPALQKQAAEELLRKPSPEAMNRMRLDIAYPDIPKDEAFVSVLFCVPSGGENSAEALCSAILVQLEKEGIPAIVSFKEPCFAVAQVCLKTKSGRRMSKEELRTKLRRICRLLSPVWDAKAIAGSEAQGLEQVYTSYMDAVIAFNNDFFYRPSEVLFFDDLPPKPRTPLKMPDSLAFGRLLEEGNEEGCTQFIQDSVQLFERLRPDAVSTIKDFFAGLLGSIARVAAHKGISLPEPMNDTVSMRETLLSFPCLSDIGHFLDKNLRQYFLFEKEIRQGSDVVGRIKACIVRRYADSTLSLSSIAEELGFAPSYLCVLFKKDTGKTLSRYITDYRMERACEYLVNTDTKVKTIAALLGYTDCNYFIKAFKKSIGVTPLYYREIKGNASAGKE